MGSPADQFKINLNQNLWGLLVSFGFLGGSEYFNLPVLFWLALVSACVMTLSVCFTTIYYTMNYMKNKSK